MKNFTRKMGLAVLVAVVSLSLALTGCSKEAGEWGTDYESACTAAKENGTNVLIFFSNLETDPISQDLNVIFSSPKFQSKVGKNYQLVNIDFPTTEGAMDYEKLMDNYELANSFAVQGVPSILAVTPEGYVIGSLVGQELFTLTQDPNKPFVVDDGKVLKDLVAFNKPGKNMIKLSAELEKTEGIERLSIIDKMLENLDVTYRPLVSNLINEIPELDPENTTGLYSKYQIFFAYEKALKAFSSGDAQSAIDIFVKCAETEGVPVLDAQEAYQTAAYLAGNIGAPVDVMLDYLQKAVDIAPDSEYADGIREMISMMQAQMGPMEEGPAPETNEVTE